MKYEYLCGCESDFFAMPENVITIVRLDHCVQGLTEFSQITECGKPVLAMRRIIEEPKRWTVEDKKARRLPEVGCKVATIHNFDCTVVGVDEERKNIAIQHENGKLAVVSVHCVSPIETPEKKAQREEDEFINSLISVDIPVGGFFNQGARAAYRKLKGGE